MNFKLLKVYQDDDTEDGILIASYDDVNVQWELYGTFGSTAVAIQNGVQLCQLQTFDDYPIEILTDYIEIRGIVDRAAKEPLSEYGHWIIS